MTKRDLAYLLNRKRAQEPITMLTCYDYPTAQMQDAAGIDVIFVGDSVGTNILGYATETEVTMADMLHHLKAVRRGVRDAYLLVDMPAGSYDSQTEALANAQSFIAAGADGVKLEGGQEVVDIVHTLTSAKIEVCGHIGFTPQTLGTRARIQGRSFEQGKNLINSAIALEQAGASMLVLELVSEPISQLVTARLGIPTIGIGSGRYCDGQVLVLTDVLGISTIDRKLFKRYDQFYDRSVDAFTRYKTDVESHLFPSDENVFNKISDEDLSQLRQWLNQTH